MNTINTAQFSDGFGPVSLARFAAAPGSSHVFRVQHALLARCMDAIVFDSHSYAGGTREEMAERALEVANSMTTLRSMLETHQVLESSLMHKVLASDPRQRLAAEQFEREAASAITEFEKLLISFGAPSQILAHMTDFSSKAGAVFARIKERFKAEERDLFPVFDRLTAGEDAPVSAANLPVEEVPTAPQMTPLQADKGYLVQFQTSEVGGSGAAVDTGKLTLTTPLPADAAESGGAAVDSNVSADAALGAGAPDEAPDFNFTLHAGLESADQPAAHENAAIALDQATLQVADGSPSADDAPRNGGIELRLVGSES